MLVNQKLLIKAALSVRSTEELPPADMRWNEIDLHAKSRKYPAIDHPSDRGNHYLLSIRCCTTRITISR
jgi:hypothetical protein